MTTLLVTRPRGDAAELAAALEDRGFTALVEPLLEVTLLAGCKPVVDAMLELKPRLLLATSRHAIRFLAELTARRDIPLKPVGAASASLASSLGFTVPEGVCETAEELLAFVMRHHPPASGRVLYLRGEDVTTDISGALAAHGYSVDAAVLYRAVPASALSDHLAQEIAGGRVGGALFFSCRTAQAYVSLVHARGLAEAHRAMRAVCMSGSMAKELALLPWQSVGVANAPDMAHMLAVVDNCFKTAG